MSDYDTRPTIETLLEEMRKGFAAIADEFNLVYMRLDGIEQRLTRIEERLDRLDRRQSNQDHRLDDFIQEVIDLKRDIQHPI